MVGIRPVPDAVVFDHVAIAVEEHRMAWPRYAGDLGGRWLSGGWGLGFAPGQLEYANGMKVEVLKPYRIDLNDFLRRFLDSNGPGPHHLTFKVPSLDDALARAEAAALVPVGVERSQPHWQEAFIHPRQVPGVVVQLAEASGPEWSSPQPASWPSPRTQRPASLDYVAHAVVDLDQARPLFETVLQGTEVARGEDEAAKWVELSWPGGGRLRLVTPTSAASPVTAWLGGRPGRILCLAFTVEDPAGVADAVALADGAWEVRPEANLGVRLRLTPSGSD
ncbi:MAG TPA: VOC family protein [Acidimicrobiales bacterium]|nr:VOC family protein [Acidimicrobiales bacterium]